MYLSIQAPLETAEPIQREAEEQGGSFSLLVPGGLPDPVKGETCVCPDLNGSCLGLPDSLLHGLHQVLSVVDQHLSGLVEKGMRDVVMRISESNSDLLYSSKNNNKHCLPALTPLRWCWYDPTWWPWLWTGFWAECWWWGYVHTPGSRSESQQREKKCDSKTDKVSSLPSEKTLTPLFHSLTETRELTWSRLVRIRLSVHCLATSFASRVTSSEALAMSLAHWMRARLLPLPPRTRRDISAMSKAIRLAAPMMSFPYEVQRQRG